MIIFAGLYYVLDYKKNTLPGKNFFLDFGVNSIFAYVIHYIATAAITWAVSKLLIDKAMALGFSEKAATVLPVILFILAHWYFLRIMRRKDWIVKV